MMNILFIVPYMPTPIRVRPYNLIKHLAARGHKLTLATLWSSPEEHHALAELESWSVRVIAAPLPRWRSMWNCLRALPTPMPLQAVYCRSPQLRDQVERELYDDRGVPNGSYDIVHVEHLRGAYYGLRLEGVPVVWDSVDCISYLFEQAARDSRSLTGRWMARFDLGRTRRYEGFLVGHFDRVLVTSEVDKLALEDLAIVSGNPVLAHDRRPSMTVLSNGVDLEYFTPATEPREQYTIVYLGKMSYHANVTAVVHLVREILPAIWQKRPQVKLYIVGANPTRQVRRLADQFPGQIEVTGTVPDVRPYLQQCSVAVAPVLYGAGIQNKLLESMACGTPVVAMPRACAALQTVDGQDLLVARDPGEFARRVLGLLDSQEFAARIGMTGRQYVEQHHGWPQIVTQLETIYQEVIEDRP